MTSDEQDAVQGDGLCETSVGNGECTLRAAIEEANAQPGADIITFDIPTTDPGYDGGYWTVSPLNELPDLSSEMIIEGPGQDLLKIKPLIPGFRLLHVSGEGAVSLSGLSLENGYVSEGNGGAICNESSGVLNLSDCVFRYNSADGNGGALSNESTGSVNLSYCTFSTNFARQRGGGITNQSTGTINVTNSTIDDNSAYERGGGITNQSTGTVNVTNSTVRNNTAINGGGIRQSGSGTINVTNCTIYGNKATDSIGGGGIFNLNTGSLNVTNCTISNNVGRGLVNQTSGTFTVKSSIVALNRMDTLAESDDADISGSFNSAGYNLIGTIDRGIGFTQSTDQTGTAASPLEPGLDPAGLQDHGGPTSTLALLTNSPALDKGTSDGLTGPLTADQRGGAFDRSFDQTSVANASGGDGTDIGAFERQTPVSPVQTRFGNISTRVTVGTGDSILIGGFIVRGEQAKKVIVRAIGPSLPFSNALLDPFLELHDSSGAVIAGNDDWKFSVDKQEIINAGLEPTDGKEAAIVATLNSGAYTVTVQGSNGGIGIGLVEIYDLDRTVESKLVNISTRGSVQTNDDVMIGGLIVLGPDSAQTLVRAIGPSLPLMGALADPTLELYDDNGAIIASNDNWRSDQEAEIAKSTLPPPNDVESAIFVTLPPGLYTAIVRGANNTTGVALIEAYQLDN